MGIFNKRVQMVPGELLHHEAELEELAEDLGFTWPRDRGKLERIHRIIERGDSFTIVKQMQGPTGAKLSRPVAHVDHFPDDYEVEELTSETYGGGSYSIYGGNDRSRVLRVVRIQGESKTPEAATNGHKPSSKLEDVIESNLTAELQNNPELMAAAMTGLLEKRLKVRLGKEEKGTPLEQLREFAEDFRSLQELLGGGGDSWKTIVGDIAKSLGAPITDLLKQGMTAGRPIPPMQGVETTHVPAAVPEHYTAIRQPTEHELSPVSGQVPREHQENRVIGVSQSADGDESTEGGMQQTEINWVQLLTDVNWQEVQVKSQGDPGEFVQWAWSKAIQEQSQGHRMLVELFLNNEPRKIVETLGTGLQRLHEPMTVAFIKLAGKEKDLTTITDLLTPLLTTQGGVRWLVACRLGALEIAKRIDAEQGEDDESAEEEGTGTEASRREWLEESQQHTGGEPVLTVPNLFGENGHVADDGRLM